MQVLVTGATGLVGNAIVRKLVERGSKVRALVRNADKARSVVPSSVELLVGDVTDFASIKAAMQGVELVFHAAGMPEQWQADEHIFDRVNREGTANVLNAAIARGVRRVVYTSTMDVFAAPSGGTLQESNIDKNVKPTAYERSKQAAERVADELRSRGIEVVFLNPGAVYGPSPAHVSLNGFFLQVLRRETPVLPPGGMPIAFVDAVADAHLVAAERGVDGERYLLADEYVTMQALAAEILRHTTHTKVPPVVPLWTLRVAAGVMAPLARRFGFTPLVAPGQVQFLSWDIRVDASKAKRELNYTPVTLEEGVKKTVEFLRQEGLFRVRN